MRNHVWVETKIYSAVRKEGKEREGEKQRSTVQQRKREENKVQVTAFIARRARRTSDMGKLNRLIVICLERYLPNATSPKRPPLKYQPRPFP